MKMFIKILIFLFLFTQISLSQGNWRKAGDMPERRFAHSADELNGKIYVVGGVTDEGSTLPLTALVLDKSNGQWIQIPLAENKPRNCHTSCVIDGKLYVVGGNNGVETIATMDMYDPGTGKWIAKKQMPTDRGLAASAALDGKIYVIGGISGKLISLNWKGVRTVEVYDTKSDTWTQAADMPSYRWGLTAIAANGKIYVFGGRSDGAPFAAIEMYDPKTNIWTTLQSKMNRPRYCLSSCLLDSNIYVIGGWFHSSSGPVYDVVETYNFYNNEMKIGNPLPAERAVIASTVINGRIYVIGGSWSTHPNHGTSEIYEFTNKDIFAKQSFIDKTFAKLNLDSVGFRTEFFNPFNHQFTAYLILAGSDYKIDDSLKLYDDGLHCDLLAGDGTFGCYIPPRSTEDFFRLSVSTTDMQSNKYYPSQNLCSFTTAGPVVLDSISIFKNTNWYDIRPYIRNAGARTIRSASIRMLSSDPWVFSISSTVYYILPDLIPGKTITGPLAVLFYIDSIYKNKGYFNLKANVFVNGWPYWIDSVKAVPTSIRSEEYQKTVFYLEQNYPNPFNSITVIKYSVPKTSFVTLKIYDILGKEILTLVKAEQPAGSYSVMFDAGNLAGGIYMYQLLSGNHSETKKLIVLK